MDRKPHELLIATSVLEQMLARGHESRPFRVLTGPDSEAKIIGSRVEADGFGGGWVVLVYDRPVDEPTLQSFQPEDPDR